MTRHMRTAIFNLNIAELRQVIWKRAQPILSMDTKRREMLGDYAARQSAGDRPATCAGITTFPRTVWAWPIPTRTVRSAAQRRLRPSGRVTTRATTPSPPCWDWWRSFTARRYPDAGPALAIATPGQFRLPRARVQRAVGTHRGSRGCNAFAWPTIPRAAQVQSHRAPLVPSSHARPVRACFTGRMEHFQQLLRPSDDEHRPAPSFASCTEPMKPAKKAARRSRLRPPHHL